MADINVYGAVLLIAEGYLPYREHQKGYIGAYMAINSDLIFPICIDYGSQIEMAYKVDKNEVDSGSEQRNLKHEYPKHRYSLRMDNFNSTQVSQVVRIFHVSSNSHVGFLFLDPMDHTSAEVEDGYYADSVISDQDQLVGIADGVATAYNIYKYYTYQGASKRRRIRHVKGDTFIAAIDGVACDRLVWNEAARQAEWEVPVGSFATSATMTGLSATLTGFDGVAAGFEEGDLILIEDFVNAENNSANNNDPMRIVTITPTEMTVTRFSGVNAFVDETANITIKSAPVIPANAVIRCGFEFYVPVRFDMDSMGMTPRAGYAKTVIADVDNVVLKEIPE